MGLDSQDFFWKANVRELDAEEVNLDIHHIFPQHWCETHGVPRRRYDAIVNKTPISFKANRMIGGAAPSRYLATIQRNQQVQIDDAAMNAILESHLIEAVSLRADDFEEFYSSRKRAMLALIERTMGKQIGPDSVASEGEEEGPVSG